MMKLVNHFLKYLKSKYMNIIKMSEFRSLDHMVGIGFGSRPKSESFGNPNLDLWLELA